MADATLPGDAVRTPLPVRVIRYWRLSSLIVGVPVVIGLAVVALVVSGLPMALRVALLVVPLLLAVAEFAATPVRYRTWWYAVSEEQIDVERGWLFKTRTVVPMTRVQHVELQRGPIASRFRLAELEIHTAAGSVKIPALDATDGEQIRQRIADLARIADDL
jgi:membrane protein YdbS with pleckstrin-like domain